MSVDAPEAPAVPPAEPAAPAAPPAPAQPPAPQQQAPAVPAQPAAPPEPDWKAQAEAARQEATAAKAEADRIRAEADRWKQQSRQQEARSKANHAELKNRDALLREIAAKVGVDFDDKPDPEVLTQRLAETQQRERQRTVELAVYTTTAATAGANPLAILDSREFMAQTAALDPDAADFPSRVAELVQEAAKQPRYQFQQPPAPPAPEPAQAPAQPQQQAPVQPPAAPPATSSGADFSGAPGQGRLWTQADYDNYMASSHIHDRDGRKLTEAIGRGELAALGIGPGKRRNRR
jgi:hypothetical protein